MTQFESPFDAGDPGEQKISGLAIGSLVCSLICCVPVTTIPGILLGIWAMVSIGNNPARKGKGLAVAGIMLGVRPREHRGSRPQTRLSGGVIRAIL